MRLAASVIALLAFTAPAFAQDSAPEPQTKLEQFGSNSGVVIVRGFTDVGTVRGEYGTSVTVAAREYMNAQTDAREYGISVEVKDNRDRSSTSYIDYDEIDGLIQGLDYIGRIDNSVSQLGNFQADYRTRGDLTISTFNSGRDVMWAAESGRIGSTSAYFNIGKLSDFRSLIQQAKQRLDSIR